MGLFIIEITQLTKTDIKFLSTKLCFLIIIFLYILVEKFEYFISSNLKKKKLRISV